jgi:hypothetical protein
LEVEVSQQGFHQEPILSAERQQPKPASFASRVAGKNAICTVPRIFEPENHWHDFG